MSTAFKDFYECEATAFGIGIGWRPWHDGPDLVGRLAMIKTVVSVWQQASLRLQGPGPQSRSAPVSKQSDKLRPRSIR